MDRLQGPQRETARQRGNEPQQAYRHKAVAAHTRRGGDIPARVRTLAPRYVRQHQVREPLWNQRLVGLCRAAVAVHGELLRGKGVPTHIRLPLPDRRANTRRIHRADCKEPQLQYRLLLPQTGELRSARYGLLHQEGRVHRRHSGFREGGMEQSYGDEAAAGHLHDHAVLTHHVGRLCSRILQL